MKVKTFIQIIMILIICYCTILMQTVFITGFTKANYIEITILLVAFIIGVLLGD